MNKFRKKLASVVLSTSVLAGGVTTCLITSSTVDYCKATTPEEEMKNQEKIKKQVKEILEKDEEPIVTAQVKARPKHAKVPRPEPIEYDYEYDETEEPDSLE